MKVDTKSLMVLKKVIKDKLGVDAEITKDEMARYDLFFSYKGKEWIGESKVRRFGYSQYKDTMINEDKYNFLIKNNAMLFVFFYDGLYVCQDIAKAFKYKKEIYCKNKTDFSGGYNTWSTKVYLDLDKFKKLDIEPAMIEWIYM